MTSSTIAILSPGDMGHAVGRALIEGGRTVITCLEGRSERSHALAEKAGLRAAGTLDDLVEEADLILSILPPAAAAEQAETAARAMKRTGSRAVYADMNAVSPATARRIHDIVAAAGAAFIDGGIIGWAPGRGGLTRFYVSGPDCSPLEALDGLGIRVHVLGEEIGAASGMKMCFAGITKGRSTLYTAALLTAAQLDLLAPLRAELQENLPDVHESMERMIPRLAADSGRWIGEMEEIAATFDSAGVTPKFHEAAAWVFDLLSRSDLAGETRETVDPDRGVEETLASYLKAMHGEGGGQ